MILCFTRFCVENNLKKQNTPEYKVFPHFQWKEQQENNKVSDMNQLFWMWKTNI